MKISKSEIFTGTCHFFAKIVKKWLGQKILVEESFLSKSIQPLWNATYKENLEIEYFSITKFFLGLSHFYSVHQSNSEAINVTKDYRLAPKGSDQTKARPGVHLFA